MTTQPAFDEQQWKHDLIVDYELCHDIMHGHVPGAHEVDMDAAERRSYELEEEAFRHGLRFIPCKTPEGLPIGFTLEEEERM